MQHNATAAVASDATEARISLWAALAVAVPLAAAVLVIIAFVATEVAGVHVLTLAPPENVAEAVDLGDGARALALIRSGQDPNQRWLIPQGNVIDSRRDVHITPIEAAILTRRAEFVGLMLRHGARPETPAGLACLVQAVDIESDVPPSVFGLTDGTYYRGAPVRGIDALDTCGFPSE